jgi:hypothetical protein
MEPISKEMLQMKIDEYKDKEVFLQLETNGAYANHLHEKMVVGAYIRNAKILFELGKITGDGPYRVGLKMELGWVYAEGLTHYEVVNEDKLLVAGHDSDGKLAVAFQLSFTPFK